MAHFVTKLANAATPLPTAPPPPWVLPQATALGDGNVRVANGLYMLRIKDIMSIGYYQPVIILTVVPAKQIEMKGEMSGETYPGTIRSV